MFSKQKIKYSFKEKLMSLKASKICFISINHAIKWEVDSKIKDFTTFVSRVDEYIKLRLKILFYFAPLLLQMRHTCLWLINVINSALCLRHFILSMKQSNWRLGKASERLIWRRFFIVLKSAEHKNNGKPFLFLSLLLYLMERLKIFWEIDTSGTCRRQEERVMDKAMSGAQSLGMDIFDKC